MTDAPTRPTRQEHKHRTREDIRCAALDLFERHGFDETTIDDIAAGAAIGRRTFFRYFSCKEAVLFTGGVLQEICTDFDAALAAGVPPMRALFDAIERDAYRNEPPDASTIRRRLLRVALLHKPSVSAFYRHQIGVMASQVTDIVRKHPEHADIRFLPELVGGLIQTMTLEHLDSGETHHLTANMAPWRSALLALGRSFDESPGHGDESADSVDSRRR